MFSRTNVLIRRFGSCSVPVKLRLFKTFSVNFYYDIALSRSYLKCSIQKLRSCYNRCTKMFFRYSGSYSLSQVLVELNLCSFDTLLFNRSFRFMQRWKN